MFIYLFVETLFLSNEIKIITHLNIIHISLKKISHTMRNILFSIYYNVGTSKKLYRIISRVEIDPRKYNKNVSIHNIYLYIYYIDIETNSIGIICI